jgi:plasmid maintenance system antidote protein VapI
MLTMPPSAADLRSAIARRNILIYHLAARIGLHPSRLSLILNERVPLTPDLAAKIMRAVESE